MPDAEVFQQFADWIRNLGISAPPSKDIVAFNFGLLESEEGSYRLYVSGAKSFDPDNDDWACEKDYYPDGRYLDVSFDKDGGWESMLTAAIGLITRYVESSEFRTSFLKNARAITVGFDDGDLKRIR